MHEYSVACALLDQIEAAARAHDATAVKVVHLALGAQCGVEAGLLTGAFELARAGTVAAEAELSIRPVPVRWVCPRCGGERPPGAPLVCPDDGTPARLEAGDELILERLEMEV